VSRGFRREAGSAGILAGTTGLVYQAILLASLHAASLGALGLSAAWFAGALSLWTLAGFFGLRVVRGRELEADHFAAWLTDPAWLVEFFAERIRSREAPRSMSERIRSFAEALLSDHPGDGERIRRLGKSYGLPRLAMG
jgi:Zn-dependent protease with chaperone function